MVPVRDNAVRTVAGYALDMWGFVFRLPAWARYFFLLQCPDRVSGPHSLLFFSQGVKFSRDETRHSSHLVPKLRISVITGLPPLPLYVLMTCAGTTLPETGFYSSFVTGTTNKSGDRLFGKGVANIMTPQTTLLPGDSSALWPTLS